MRISTNMVNADFLNNLATTTNKVQSTMNQLASLKEVNKASLPAPVHIGDVAIKNLLGTGIDIVATNEVD